MSASAQLMRSAHLAKLEANMADNRPATEDCEDLDEGYQTHSGHIQGGHISGASCALRQSSRTDNQQLGVEFDYAGAARASYFGRRAYPSFDPSHSNACPLRFVRQFEHAAQHNGLQQKAWTKRFNSCLYGRAEDWAFDECPLETSVSSWEVRKRQFLDWALLPAEQELRRQRLLRFYQAESDMSIDFVHSFEEVSRGLRDFKEDVWVRKCIANLVSPIRTALFELWPDGLPVRFRDLRDSLYAVDWSLYEAASVPLKVVRYGTPYVYETYTVIPSTTTPSRVSTSSNERSQYQQQQQQQQQRPHSQHQQQPSRPSMSISVNRVYSPPAPSPAPLSSAKKKRQALATTMSMQNRATPNSATVSGTLSPRASSESPSNKTSLDIARATPNAAGLNAGLYELVNTLSRISEKERSVIMVALEKMAAIEDSATAAVATGAGDGLGVTTGGASISGHTRSQPRHAGTASVSASASAPGTASALAHASAATAVCPSVPPLPSPSVRPTTSRAGHSSRAAAAAAIAATAQLACMDSNSASSAGGVAMDGGMSSGEVSSRSSAADDRLAARHLEAAAAARNSDDSSDGLQQQQQPVGKIRLRTRPLTSIACCNHRASSPIIEPRRDISDSAVGASAAVQTDPIDAPIASADTNTPLFSREHDMEQASRRTHARKLSSRKSDSALTTATRSMRAADLFYRDSADNALRSPEFTVLHPAIDLRPPHTRRGRFAFIKKLSHMLTPH
ncbi:hypothetical protein IWW45_000210 [Coemansia sp. RSA 485]|nr:hypothetical protein IWW45_000210 [Coemansia sp. RSA 485]